MVGFKLIKQSEAITRFWSTPGTSFKATISTVILVYGNSFVKNSNGSTQIVVSEVELPDGAIISEVTVFGDDTSGTWTLERNPKGSTLGLAMESASINSTDTSIGSSTINNSSFVYTLSSGLLADNKKIFGAVIKYSIQDFST